MVHWARRFDPRTSSRVILFTAVIVTCVMLYGAMALGFDRYSVNRDATNCGACHGSFRGAAPYRSEADGVAWKNPSTNANLNLHDGHRTFMLNGDCNACHVSAGRFPTYLGQSAGGNGLSPIGCVGCHGRAEPAAGGTVTGAGLRQHHFRNGITSCGSAGCHTDADPASFTTANEHTFPPFYATPDAAHPNKPANPCNNLGGSEGAVAPPNGLDNDGDLVYDGAEPDCDVTPAHTSTWGRVKTIYR
jgi:hypothetical protein